jgi:glycosyltransferase involved in cell wall biosynthesis
MNIEKIDAPAEITQLVSGRAITNLMFLIWNNRKDLQQAFDIYTKTGQEGFISWCDVALEREYGISPTIVTGGTTDCVTEKERRRTSIFLLLRHLQLRLSGTGMWLPKPVRDRAKIFWFRVMKRSNLLATNQCSGVAASGNASGQSDHLQDMGDPGVNLIGYVHAELGMGEHVRMSAASFAKTDVKYGVVNFHVGVSSRKQAQLTHGTIISSNVYKTNLFHINADQMLTAFCHLGRDFFSNRYNIGYWLWELSRCPDEWLPVMGLVDEIWAPSRFIQQSFAERTSLPVEYMPLCVQLPPLKDYRREYYGLPADSFLFLFAFDFFSFIDRKNPFAVIDAFKRAFPDTNKKAGLVIKIMNGDPCHPRWKYMSDIIGDDPRINIINKVMTRDEVIGLINDCDCFVSLHRSEGFGFGPAEAMYMGKPVIVTNYSGNTDFTLPDNSCLVDYRLIPVIEGQYVFDRGQVWADPDIEHAAWYMRKLASENEYGTELGKRAAAFIRENHSPTRVGALYYKRLKELNLA